MVIKTFAFQIKIVMFFIVTSFFIVLGMKKYEYKGKQWHEMCFCCKVCREPIGSKSFIPRDQEVICIDCYEKNYAQRCTKCDKVRQKFELYNYFY